MPLGKFIVASVRQAHSANPNVIEETIRLAFQKRGTVACSRALDGFAGSFVHGYHIHSVDDDAWHAVASGTVGDIDDCLMVGLRCVFAIAVVLTDENDWQFVQSCHIGRFVDRALIACTVAKKGDGDVPGFLELVRECGAHSDRWSSTDDAICTQHADLHVGDVHAATFALAVTVDPSKYLREHPVKLSAFGDQMTVTAMRARDLISVRQVNHNPRRDRFLANI